MEIRKAEPRDKEEWLRMRRILWENTARETHLGDIEEFFAGGSSIGAVFLLIRPDGKAGGFLEASIRPYADGCITRNVGYIEGWYVDPDLRRMGHGRRLVQEAEKWAIYRGCGEMASDCFIDNEVSLKGHLSMGYGETERLIHFRKPLVDQE